MPPGADFLPGSIYTPVGPIIDTLHPLASGVDLTAMGSSVLPVSTTWPAANEAIYCPFSVQEGLTVAQLFCYNGATANGNVDVGIFDDGGAKLISSGSTAQAGTSALQVFDVADTFLEGNNRYYLAMACSSATATVFARTITNTHMAKACGWALQLTAFALPASFTLAAYTHAFCPVFGFTTRTVL